MTRWSGPKWRNSSSKMDTQRLVSSFLEKNFTKAQAQRRLRVLQDFLNWALFENSGKELGSDSIKTFVDSKLINTDPKFYLMDGQFMESLGVEYMRQFDARNLTKQLGELESGIGKTRQVVIYLALELPPAEIERLGQWFKQNVGSDCLIDIQYKASLIGGAALSFGGTVKDYSIRARIESEKKEILKTLLDFRK